MKDKLEVIVTSGGTISKIDDVRHIGNFSTGETGAKIAEEFLKKGNKVHYFYGHNSQRPFRRDMVIDPDRDFGLELNKAVESYFQFRVNEPRLMEHSTPTFTEYYNVLNRILVDNPIDVVILGAAVGDYGAEYNKGKISSDKEKLVIEMARNPKVISKVKKWNSYIYQVGFKLLSDVSEDHLIEMAYQHGLKNDSDLTIANLKTDDPENRPVFFVKPDKTVVRSSASDLASDLVRNVYEHKVWEYE
tara:strand:+ start:1564 stop:2301 length:738 start_codon:yes stop_codon:yes gene_type:complete